MAPPSPSPSYPSPVTSNSNNGETPQIEESIDEIISTLPKDQRWVTHSLYLYQGFWYNHRVLKGTILAQQNFIAQSTDILLATHPKCGTTWLKSLAFAIKNRATTAPPPPQTTVAPPQQTTALPPQTPNPLLVSNAHALIPNIEFGTSFQRYSMEGIEHEDVPLSPRLFATHVPYGSLPESVPSVGCKVVYLCRDPKDMFVSLWHFFTNVNEKEIPPISLNDALDLFCQGISFFGPYWEHVLGYYKASLKWPKRVLFLKYEEMQVDTLNQVKGLAEFLGSPFTLEEEAKGVVEEIVELCSFEKMRNLEVSKNGKLFGVINIETFFRKGKVGDSKNYLTSEMAERIDAITKDKFQGFELGF